MRSSFTRRLKMHLVGPFPLLRRLGSGHDAFHRYPRTEVVQKIAEVSRGEKSQIILTGKHTHGIYGLQVKSWGEGAHLFIGSFCSIGASCKVQLGGNHRTDWSTTYPFGHISNDIFPSGLDHASQHPVSNGHVIIENDIWIGESSTIMSGVRIGSGAVVAACSVVARDVPPYAIVGGNPAKLIRFRFPPDVIQQILDLGWWSYPDDIIDSIVPLLQQYPDSQILDQIRRKLRASSHEA